MALCQESRTDSQSPRISKTKTKRWWVTDFPCSGSNALEFRGKTIVLPEESTVVFHTLVAVEDRSSRATIDGQD